MIQAARRLKRDNAVGMNHQHELAYCWQSAFEESASPVRSAKQGFSGSHPSGPPAKIFVMTHRQVSAPRLILPVPRGNGLIADLRAAPVTGRCRDAAEPTLGTKLFVMRSRDARITGPWFDAGSIPRTRFATATFGMAILPDSACCDWAP